MNAENFTARVLPATEWTWELRDSLPGATQETPRLSLNFPGPIEVLGVHPSVALAGAPAGGALIVPTTEDILVRLDANQKERITNTTGRGTLGVTLGSSLVTLAALASDVRWLRWLVTNAQPDLGVQFRWKPDVSGGAVFEDSIVSLAFFLRFLPEGGA